MLVLGMSSKGGVYGQLVTAVNISPPNLRPRVNPNSAKTWDRERKIMAAVPANDGT
jgi:hypothetical protein